MRILVVLLSLFCLSDTIYAQNDIGSLRAQSLSKEENSTKLNSLVRLTEHYLWSIPESTVYYGMQGLPLARKLRSEEEERNLCFFIGEAFSGKGNFALALDYQLKGLKLSEKLNDQDKIAWSIAGVGSVYFYSQDYENALNYFKRLRNFPEAYLKNEELFSAFIGEAFFHLGKNDSAFNYINHSYALILKNPYWSIPFYYMGKIFARRNLYEQAFEFYRSGLQISDNTLSTIEGYNGIAEIFSQAGKSDSAIFYAKKALAFCLDLSFSNKAIESSLILKDVYKKMGKTDSAFKYQEIMLAAKDSVYSQGMVKQMQSVGFNEQLKQQELKSENEAYRNRLKMYAVIILGIFFLAIAMFFWRNNRQKQKAKTKIEAAYTELKSTQAQLIQSEKMASLGELTAGIAHEIQNPLNFVNNFSEVNKELIEELQEERRKEIRDLKSEDDLLIDIKENEQKINHHGKRADAIVKGMLQHSRVSTGKKESIDVNALADEYFRLAYHGLRAKDKGFNATLKTDFDESIGNINIIPQDIGRVILNLYNNAFYAVGERKKQKPDGYEPIVSISTKRLGSPLGDGGKIEITVKDNGNGIPPKILDKIFQPFFTTKPTGQGTGLGLSLSYDIIKAHGGEIKVETKEGVGAEFIIQLPI